MPAQTPGGGGTSAEYTLNLAMGEGLLTNVSIYPDETFSHPLATFITIYLTETETSRNAIHTALYSGYCSIDHPVSANGLWRVNTTTLLRIDFIGDLNPIFSVYDHRITDRALQEIIGTYAPATSPA